MLFVVSAGQKYPEGHCPEQEGVASPGELPYRPAGQGAVQAAEDSPEVEPYLPAGQGFAVVSPAAPPKVPGGQLLHTLAPGALYDPGPQTATVGDVEPCGQANPAPSSSQRSLPRPRTCPPGKALYTEGTPGPSYYRRGPLRKGYKCQKTH